MDFDGKVWPLVGGFGRYTRLVAVATWLPNLAIALGFFSEDLFTARPVYQCPEDPGATRSECEGNSSGSAPGNLSHSCPGGWRYDTQGWLENNIITQMGAPHWYDFLPGDGGPLWPGFVLLTQLCLLCGPEIWIRCGSGRDVPLFLCSNCHSLFPESPRWLLATQQLERCKEELRLFSRANGIDMPDNISGPDGLFTEIDCSCESVPRPRYYSICSIFRTRLIWRNALILGFTTFIGCGIRPCFMRNLQTLGPYIPYFLQAGSEVLACIMLCITVNHWGRRAVLLLCTILTGFCSLLLLAMTQYLFSGATLAISALGSLCAHAVVMLSIFYAGEVLPTVLRASGLGFIIGISMIGRAAFPIIELQEKAGFFLHHVVLSSFCILSVLSILLLPETKRKSLPENLRQGDSLRRPPLLIQPHQDAVPLLPHTKKVRMDYNPDSYARLASSTKKMITRDRLGTKKGAENRALTRD
uniref:Solute carrier family 22 member 31 n=1 Tax=Leptobrachium leishanense TaxID=445787 RepID=A0A8C5N0J8_9ANUR